ncbi:unnamed protein product [Periconia digitata]|uniref:Uncharacterized protein n=1 Tax=Periconia digitata TaxID=1303443 RepID=A0A9W4UGY3_9PLEO|nr:unnamed protein product [Periconia digitata]
MRRNQSAQPTQQLLRALPLSQPQTGSVYRCRQAQQLFIKNSISIEIPLAQRTCASVESTVLMHESLKGSTVPTEYTPVGCGKKEYPSSSGTRDCADHSGAEE